MPFNPDGTLRPYSAEEIALIDISTTDVRSGAHPTEAMSPMEATVKRTFFCDWRFRFDFVSLVIGEQCAVGDVTINGVTIPPVASINGVAVEFPQGISRVPPDPVYGVYPYLPNCYATKIESITGQGAPINDGGPGRVPSYPRAKVVVHYEVVPYQELADSGVYFGSNFDVSSTVLGLDGGVGELLRCTWQSDVTVGGDSITGTGGMMKYGVPGGGTPDGKQIPYSYNVIRPVQDWSVFWEKVPYSLVQYGGFLDQKIQSYMGMINTVEFYGWGPGTVLFLGANKKLRRSVSNPQNVPGNGSVAPDVDVAPADYLTWSVEYKFVSTPVGHLNLRYFDLAGAGAANGWYFAGTQGYKNLVTDPIPDYSTIVQGLRDLNGLFMPFTSTG